MDDSKPSPPASRMLLETVAAHALNNSAGDRQLQETLLLEAFQVRYSAEVDALRCRQSSGKHTRRSSLRAAESKTHTMKISTKCSFHSVAALLGGTSVQAFLLVTLSRTHLQNFLAPNVIPHSWARVEHPCDVLGHERRRLAVAACARVGVARQQ